MGSSRFRIGNNENEGITVLKQRDYEKLKGIPASENGYDINYNIVEQWGYIIGRENLIQKHFYNDTDGIRNDLKQYGIDYDQMLEMSKEFQITFDEFDLESWNRLLNLDDRKLYEEQMKEKYQDIMVKGFIAKRCKELGIEDYKQLSIEQKKRELEELEKFEKFKICDSPELIQIREYLQEEKLEIKESTEELIEGNNASQPKTFIQRIKDFFTKIRTKKLPEGTIESSIEENTQETRSWDLVNWGIDVEEFREESYQIVQENLIERKNRTQNEKQIEGLGPWDMA